MVTAATPLVPTKAPASMTAATVELTETSPSVEEELQPRPRVWLWVLAGVAAGAIAGSAVTFVVLQPRDPTPTVGSVSLEVAR